MSVATYSCESCGEEYEKTRSDDEVMTEARFLWGDALTADNRVTVCEECFQGIMTWNGKTIGRA